MTVSERERGVGVPVPEIALPFEWRVGEHISVSGQNGSGKSTLVSKILTHRRYVLIIRTKPDDVTYDAHTVRTAKAMESPRYDRLVLAPRYQDQAIEIGDALERAWMHGRWTVYIDELFYAIEILKLGPEIERLLTQGRSKKISVVCGMQRPVRVTRFALSESSHVVAFYLEGRDRKTMAESASEQIAQAGASLERYQFAWYYRPTRSLWVGRYQDLGVAA